MEVMNDREPLPSSSEDKKCGCFVKLVDIYSSIENRFKKHYCKVIRTLHGRDFLAEFLATFVLVTFGNGAIAQFILSKQANGTFLTVNIGYAIGLTIGAYVAGGVTGAHMNPAVTLAMAVRGCTSWIKVIPYWIAQFLGAFLSAAVVYGVYVDAILNFDGLDASRTAVRGTCLVNATRLDPKLALCTGGIFATYPSPHLSLANGFLDQVFGTFLLVLGIFAICDSKNSEPRAGMKPFMIGFLFWGIGVSFGFNAGYAINPARDFSPRLFTAMAGWGSDVFVCSQCSISHWWWVPVIAPMVGGLIAAPIYWLFVEGNHPPLQTKCPGEKYEEDVFEKRVEAHNPELEA